MQFLHHMTEDDPDCRIEMCQWFLDKMVEKDNFIHNIMFSDEANFYIISKVNKQNMRYWSTKTQTCILPASNKEPCIL